MDVMRPEILRIGNICYRKNPIGGANKTKEDNYSERTTTLAESEQYYQDSMFYKIITLIPTCDMYMDESCEIAVNVEETSNGFRLSLAVPNAYFKYIIGKKGETKRRIEEETNTQIRIPRQGEEGNIVIQGEERRGIISANTRINLLVESARRRQPFTHFLSFPIQEALIQNNFKGFKDNVLKICGKDKGVDETIFQNPNKLHMTLGTLVLMDKNEIGKASSLLEECKQDLTGTGLLDSPLMVHINGLEYMNDDPNAVDVLYAKVSLIDRSDRLQVIADRIVNKFVSSGLMNQEYDHVKLHITVMNTLFRKNPSESSGPSNQIGRDGQRERECFNATNVLKSFMDYNFGTMNLDSLHISQRYSTGPNGYYACSGSVDLPRH